MTSTQKNMNGACELIVEHAFDSWRDFKADLFDVLEDLRHTHSNAYADLSKTPDYLFRGHACASWPLRTSFDRIMTEENVPAGRYHKLYNIELDAFYTRGMETGILRKMADIFDPTQSFYDFARDWAKYAELQAIGQHHGLPTRVLDWSESPYVGAYFAAGQPDECESGQICIWALSARSFKDLINKHIAMCYSRSPNAQGRLESQQAHFTLNFSESFTTLVDIVQNSDYHKDEPCTPVLFKLTLPVGDCPQIIQDLHYMRINDFTIYPDIEGVVMAAKRATMATWQAENELRVNLYTNTEM